MRYRTFLTFAFAVTLVGCSKPPPAEEPLAEAAVEAAPAATAPVESAASEPTFDQEFLDHMHAHAERVDELMYALDDGDLDGARTAAYWLSRHKTVEGIPDEWQMFVAGMREAASRVEGAADLQAARSAAEAISPHCQGCHASAGILANQ